MNTISCRHLPMLYPRLSFANKCQKVQNPRCRVSDNSGWRTHNIYWEYTEHRIVVFIFYIILLLYPLRGNLIKKIKKIKMSLSWKIIKSKQIRYFLISTIETDACPSDFFPTIFIKSLYCSLFYENDHLCRNSLGFFFGWRKKYS